MKPTLILALSCIAIPISVAGQPAPALQATAWTLTHLHGKPIGSVAAQATLTLELSADPARFAGSGGCNRISGTYDLRGRAISFSAVASTRMACPGLMDLEARYVDALGQVRAWRIAARMLELLDGSGSAIARFRASSQRPPDGPIKPDGFVNRVWRVSRSTGVAAGTLYAFLAEGTLLITSADSKPSLGKWTFENGRLTMIEEGRPHRTEILALSENELRIRSHNPGGAVEITLVPAAPTATK